VTASGTKSAISLTPEAARSIPQGVCAKGTQIRIPNQYVIDMIIDPKKDPCGYECELVHERVHGQQCMALGAVFFSMSEAQKVSAKTDEKNREEDESVYSLKAASWGRNSASRPTCPDSSDCTR
jgi:hypothetical protein